MQQGKNNDEVIVIAQLTKKKSSGAAVIDYDGQFPDATVGLVLIHVDLKGSTTAHTPVDLSSIVTAGGPLEIHSVEKVDATGYKLVTGNFRWNPGEGGVTNWRDYLYFLVITDGKITTNTTLDMGASGYYGINQSSEIFLHQGSQYFTVVYQKQRDKMMSRTLVNRATFQQEGATESAPLGKVLYHLGSPVQLSANEYSFFGSSVKGKATGTLKVVVGK
jgi:hypothetical protein